MTRAHSMSRPVALSFAATQCYTVTMIDPLSPAAGAAARLSLAAALLVCLWLAVAWAL